jgi:hypothetical protein
MGKSTAVARNPFLQSTYKKTRGWKLVVGRGTQRSKTHLAAAVRPLSAKVLEMTSLRAMINTIKLA